MLQVCYGKDISNPTLRCRIGPAESGRFLSFDVRQDKISMKHLFAFVVLIAGAIAFYDMWGLTGASVFLVVGLFVEGLAYWWVSSNHDDEQSN
jgi:hypothetical protein